MKVFTRMLCFCLILLCCFSNAFAEYAFSKNGEEEILQDPENGLWSYKSSDLSITITRKTDDTPLIWYEAEVYASEASPLTTILSPGKTPGRRLVNPRAWVRKNQVVLAITDDFFGFRINNKSTPGIVIRNGEILGNKTRNSSRQRGWPNLDALAVFNDGSMKSYISDAHTAEEYLNMGAVDVFSFGPVLISEGVITDYVLEDDYYPYSEPRMAIGMIDPYHYMIVAVEGRENESKGVRLSWLAEKMQELGCTEALNLDGGGTAALMFMGEVLNRSSKNMRSISSLITFGTSPLVPAK
ncbi:MAG: phosphodiester glycosidase family protein [Clostridia bacterium]|nr:phosphodiester glycosidase family protein [Clostridia bacterium]